MKKIKWMKAVVTTLIACCLASPMQAVVHAEEAEKPKTEEEMSEEEGV